MKINLYGYGFVGKAHYELLKDLHELNIIDSQYEELQTRDFEPEAAIICVSTPEHDLGHCDMTNVFDVIETVDVDVPILIKSTISLEGWRDIKERFPHHSINFSPEFLRASTYLEDLKTMQMMYLSEERATWWAKIFNPLWNDLKFCVARAEELILVKYFRNSFLATKVSFFNQVYDLCTTTGVDYTEVMNGIAQDPRIGHSHTEVTQERGFGGHCFPKDTSAIVKTGELYGVELSLIKQARTYNDLIRKRE